MPAYTSWPIRYKESTLRKGSFSLRKAYSCARSSLVGIARAAGDSERAAEDMGLSLEPSPTGAVACLGLVSSATVLHGDGANTAPFPGLATGVSPLPSCIETAACSDMGAWPLSGAASVAETCCISKACCSGMLTALTGAKDSESTAGADVDGGEPAGRSAAGVEVGCIASGTSCTGKPPESAAAEACEGPAGTDMEGGTPAWRFAAGADTGRDSAATSCVAELGSLEGAEAWEGTAGAAEKDGGTPARRSANAGMASSAEARTSITFRLSADHASYQCPAAVQYSEKPHSGAKHTKSSSCSQILHLPSWQAQTCTQL